MTNDQEQIISQYDKVYYFEHVPSRADQTKIIAKLRRKLKNFGRVPTVRSWAGLKRANSDIVVFAMNTRIYRDSYFLILFNETLLKDNAFRIGRSEFFEEERVGIGIYKSKTVVPPRNRESQTFKLLKKAFFKILFILVILILTFTLIQAISFFLQFKNVLPSIICFLLLVLYCFASYKERKTHSRNWFLLTQLFNTFSVLGSIIWSVKKIWN